MYFLRATLDPERDLDRGFSGVWGAWCDRFEDIEAAILETYPDGGDHLPPPRQDPESGEWCWEPEAGLSAFAFDDEAGFVAAMERVTPYGRHIGQVAVFEASDFDRAAGADGEDLFRGGRFVGWLRLDATFDDFRCMPAAQYDVQAPSLVC